MSAARKNTTPRVWQDIVPRKTGPLPTKKHPLSARVRRYTIKPKRLAGRLLHRLRVRTRKQKVIFAAAIILAAILASAYLLLQRSSDTTNTSPEPTTFTVDQLTKGTPDHATLLPGGKSIDQLGGWTRVSPSGTDPVYAYVDSISGITIRVSQQTLPDGFKDDVADQIKSLAEGFNANQKINVGDTVVYLDQPTKGPQSVVFTKNNLLVSIRASAAINTGLWANYVGSLQ